jgi:DNA-binding transcriptional MocR family regulator
MPRLELDWTKDPGQHNTGSYNYKTNTLYVYMAHRNLIDILRTIAHELQHRKQAAQGRLHGHSPPGSKIEREADGEAGYLVKLYGAQHPNIMQ